MGLWEWDFCLKFLSPPTKTLPLLFEGHTLTLNVRQKITNIQSIYHISMLLSKNTPMRISLFCII